MSSTVCSLYYDLYYYPQVQKKTENDPSSVKGKATINAQDSMCLSVPSTQDMVKAMAKSDLNLEKDSIEEDVEQTQVSAQISTAKESCDVSWHFDAHFTLL